MKVTDKMIQEGLKRTCPDNKFLPDVSEIPEEFKKFGTFCNPWVELMSDQFFNGLQELKVSINPEIKSSQEDILKFLNPMMRSWEKSHQEKTAGISYLLSLIFLEAQWTTKGASKSKTTARD